MSRFLQSTLAALLLLFIPLSSSNAQFVWTDLSEEENLPTGVKLFEGTQETPFLKRVYYLEIDMNEESVIVHPYWSSTYRTTTNFTGHVGAIAAINGGFFSTSASVSALVEPGELKAQNLTGVTRDNVFYQVTRGFFAINRDRSMSVDWIYHFGSTLDDLYWFSNPSPNAPGSPAPTPQKTQGSLYEQLLMGIGGGPVIVKNGEVFVTYDEEGFFGGSGLDGDSNRPRTAVGHTADNKVILLVSDSGVRINNNFTTGFNMNDLAQLMISLGAVEAMNLDGGGSTTMAVGTKLINRPNGGTTQRPVPTILAVVPIDSLKLPPTPLQEVIIDTEDDGVSVVGDAWFATANFGDSYGGAGSPSMLAPIGNGSQYVEYKPDLLNAKYEVFGWWSAAFNRANNTPYIITHSEGTTTVRVNQQQNNAQWVSLGQFTFSGNESDNIRITNEAGGGQFVVADAIRFVQLEQPVSVENENLSPKRTVLDQNYPNPFNPTTNIRFELPQSASVSVKVYDMTGRLVENVYQGWLSQGAHTIQFNASNLSSGTYMYVLETGSDRKYRLMTLIR